MAAELDIWDGSGHLLFDSASITISVLGSFTIGGSGSAASGSFTDGKMLIGGNPFSQIQSAVLNNSPVFMSVPYVWFSGSTVSWAFPASANGNYPTCRVIYGVA